MPEDLLSFYADHFRPGAIDLSASCPPPVALECFAAGTPGPAELAFVPPSGAEKLREAIAARYDCLGADDIRISSGASEGLVALAFATLRCGDCAWVAAGTYPSFIEAAGKVGARLARTPGIPPGTSVALACNPTVPEGWIFDVRAFLHACRQAGAIPVMDEVYRDLHAGAPLPSLADLNPSAVSIGDLSKPLGLGGVRIGWVATRDSELLARIDRELQLLSGGPSSLSVTAAESAFESFDETVAATMQAALTNLPGIWAVLECHRWRVVPSQAGITVLAVPPHPLSPSALARLEDAGYFLLAAETIDAPGAYRISLLRDPGTLDRALDILDSG
ncbi:MAG TPA: pyridoxal phosphate-dependent aminotransferase [Tepidiformaceae bacterium]|nr:pyridoxal phosphate-dependent aminotransferase [Tepidiformaceae bacterium]